MGVIYRDKFVLFYLGVYTSYIILGVDRLLCPA